MTYCLLQWSRKLLNLPYANNTIRQAYKNANHATVYFVIISLCDMRGNRLTIKGYREHAKSKLRTKLANVRQNYLLHHLNFYKNRRAVINCVKCSTVRCLPSLTRLIILMWWKHYFIYAYDGSFIRGMSFVTHRCTCANTHCLTESYILSHWSTVSSTIIAIQYGNKYKEKPP